MFPFTVSAQNYIKNLRGAIQPTAIALGDHEIFPPLLHHIHIVAAAFYTVLLEDMLRVEVAGVNGERETHDPVAETMRIVSKIKRFHELLEGEPV